MERLREPRKAREEKKPAARRREINRMLFPFRHGEGSAGLFDLEGEEKRGEWRLAEGRGGGEAFEGPSGESRGVRAAPSGTASLGTLRPSRARCPGDV